MPTCHALVRKDIKLTSRPSTNDHRPIVETVKGMKRCDTELVKHGEHFFWCMVANGGCGLMWTANAVETATRCESKSKGAH